MDIDRNKLVAASKMTLPMDDYRAVARTYRGTEASGAILGLVTAMERVRSAIGVDPNTGNEGHPNIAGDG